MLKYKQNITKAFLVAIIFFCTSLSAYSINYWFDGVKQGAYNERKYEECLACVAFFEEKDQPLKIAWNLWNPYMGEPVYAKYVIKTSNINSNGDTEYYGYQEGSPDNTVCVVVNKRVRGNITISFILKDYLYMDFSGPIRNNPPE